MLTKRNSKARRILSAILAILLVSYSIPFGALITAFAQNDVFTLQIVAGEEPVANELVTVENTVDEVFQAEATTNENGIVEINELTSASFGENNDFSFTVAGKTFLIEDLPEGTTDTYVYDVSTGNPPKKGVIQIPTEPEEPANSDEPTNSEDPTNPGEPSNPGGATDPEDPTNPEEQIDPEDPTNPDEPTNPEEPTPEYDVSVQQSGEGTVLIDESKYSRPVSVTAGNDVIVDVIPADHYEIESVTFETKGKKEKQTITDKQAFQGTFAISEDTEIQVVFTEIIRTISLKQIGSGLVTIKPDNEDNPLKLEVGKLLEIVAGTEVKVQVTPEEGYEIRKVTMITNGETKEKTVTNKQFYQESMVISKETEIQVEFILKEYTITFDSYLNGTIKDDQDQIIESIGGIISVLHNQDSSFTVFPNEGYHVERIVIEDDRNRRETIEDEDISRLEKVTNSDGVQGYKYKFEKVRTNYRVKVTFTINSYDVTTSVTSGRGTISLDEDEVHHGSDAKVTMTPNDGYHVTSFKVNDTLISSDIENDANFVEDELGNITYTVSNITKDTHIEVGFEEVPQLEAGWENYLSIEVKSDTGTLIEAPILSGEEGKEVRVYSNHSQLRIAPVDPFNRVNRYSNLFLGWEREFSVNSSSAIDRFLVRTNGWKNVAYVQLTEPLLLLFDKKAPELSSLKVNDEVVSEDVRWYDGAVTVSVEANDPAEAFRDVEYSTGIEHVYYTQGRRSQAQDENILEATYDAERKHYTFKTIDENYQGIYSIWTVDQAGNESEVKTVQINLDKDAPILDQTDGKAVIFEEIKKSFGEKILNFFTFGTYFNEAIKITVNAVDHASGVQSIDLIARDGEGNISETVVPELAENESDIENGLAVFTLDDDKFRGSFEVVLTDNVNNSNEEPYQVTSENSNILSDTNSKILFDKKAPVVGIVVNAGEDVYENYYNKDVTLDVNVEDADSGVNQVDIYLNGKPLARDDFSNYEDAQTAPLAYNYHTKDLLEDIAEDGSYVLSAFITDNAGNESEITKKIFVDKAAPTLVNEDGKAISFEIIHDEKWAEVLNFLSFGTFFNKKVELTVKVEDDVSGLKSILLNTSDPNFPQVEAKSVDLETGIAKYTLDVDQFKGIFSVEVTDMVGHQGIYQVSKENSNIIADNNEVMVEKNKPSVQIAVKPHSGVSSNGGNQYNGDVTFEVTVADPESGISSDSIVVNNQEFEHDYSGEDAKKVGPITYPIPTDKKMANKDGSYKISVEVYDHAGNKNTAEKTIFIDRTKPIITDFTFSTQEKNGQFVQAAKVDDLKDSVELTGYGYYFKKPTKVTVVAEDSEVDYEFTSGVQSMTLYLKDHDNGKYYVVQANGSLKEIAESEVGKIAAVATNGKISFDIPKAFKGQIFAKAADHVKNTGVFETPAGTVVENEGHHGKESHIEFDKADTSFKDVKNQELYSKNVAVDLTVTDSYSGLSEIEWSVVAPYDSEQNQKGSIRINNDRTYAEGSDSQGWKQTKTDKNLVTEMTKTLTVAHNSNDIVVKVKMRDRAGNTSEDEIKFSIDKTAPTIEVTYDNNSADPQFDDFYNQNRTATIVVTERNFSEKDIEYAITNQDGAIPKLVGWTTRSNSADPDKTTHTATISYTTDGDYTFDMKYKDNAGNQAAAFKQHQFTLDKTDPEISVTYDNQSAANGNYYRASRTATISITEHNFETGRIQVTGTASDGVAAPGVSGWSTRGDVHTATIHYSADALYSFDIAYTDKAGNVAADYQLDEFYVDQTAPELTITGVENMSANNGDVAPVVSYSDKNFNKDAVSISLTGANRGSVALAGAYANADNGQVYRFTNFEKEKEVDDLYTLTAKLVDFAGNETTETILFSVNRFGSVYVFDESLKAIEGKYVQEERDVILTETNVDNLKPETIGVKVTKNGTPSDLVEGKDYTVTESGGAGKWSQYKYVINKELFAGDGRYTVALFSEDAAGNINETIDETKKAEISFGIDKTAPVIVPIDIESGKQYPVDKKDATVSIKDNLVLDDAMVYLNGEQVEHKVDGENFSFTIPSSNEKQNVRIVALDAAGNELTNEVVDILVSTNPIVRWYNNTPLFAGSIGGFGALSLAIAAYFVIRNQRKQIDVGNDETIGG